MYCPPPACAASSASGSCPGALANTLNDLVSLVTIVDTVIAKFFPSSDIKAPIVSKMGYGLMFAPHIFAWLLFRDRYPGTYIDKHCDETMILLKDLYMEMNVDWHVDPYLNPPTPVPDPPSVPVVVKHPGTVNMTVTGLQPALVIEDIIYPETVTDTAIAPPPPPSMD